MSARRRALAAAANAAAAAEAAAAMAAAGAWAAAARTASVGRLRLLSLPTASLPEPAPAAARSEAAAAATAEASVAAPRAASRKEASPTATAADAFHSLSHLVRLECRASVEHRCGAWMRLTGLPTSVGGGGCISGLAACSVPQQQQLQNQQLQLIRFITSSAAAPAAATGATAAGPADVAGVGEVGSTVYEHSSRGHAQQQQQRQQQLQEEVEHHLSPSAARRRERALRKKRGNKTRVYDVAWAKEAPAELEWEEVALSTRGGGRSHGFVVMLDGRELLTPAKKRVWVPTAELAWAIAAEWEWQDSVRLRPYTMPLMKLATTTIDQMRSDRARVVDGLVRYFHTDQVLLRHPEPDMPSASGAAAGEDGSAGGDGSDSEAAAAVRQREALAVDSLRGRSWSSHQQSLCDRQKELWDPLVDWLRTDLGVHATTSCDVIPPHQPAEAVATLRRALDAADDWELAAVDSLAGSARSVTVGLAVAKGRLDAEAAMKAARLEENFQIESAGYVEGGHDIDEADLRVRLSAGSVFLKLLSV